MDTVITNRYQERHVNNAVEDYTSRFAEHERCVWLENRYEKKTKVKHMEITYEFRSNTTTIKGNGAYTLAQIMQRKKEIEEENFGRMGRHQSTQEKQTQTERQCLPR